MDDSDGQPTSGPGIVSIAIDNESVGPDTGNPGESAGGDSGNGDAEAGGRRRRRRGRPTLQQASIPAGAEDISVETPKPASKPKAAKATEAVGEAIGGLFSVASQVAGARLGQHWVITDEESTALGLATGKCLRHLPVVGQSRYFGIAADILALGGIAGAIFGPRYAYHKQAQADRYRDAAPTGGPSTNGATPPVAPAWQHAAAGLDI